MPTLSFWNVDTGADDLSEITVHDPINASLQLDEGQAFADIVPDHDGAGIDIAIVISDAESGSTFGTESVLFLRGVNFEDDGDELPMHLFRDPRTWKEDIFPEVERWIGALRGISRPGTYRLEMTASIRGRTIARTETKLIVKGRKGLDELKAMVAAHAESGEIRRMAEPAMSDSKLEREMLAILEKKGHEVKRVVIIQDDWSIARHETTGAVLSRSIFAQMAYRDATQGRWMVAEVSFIQPSTGPGTWGRTAYLGWGSAEEYPINEADIP